MTTDKGIFRNFFDALVESRTRQAERELSMYRSFVKTVEGEPTSKL